MKPHVQPDPSATAMDLALGRIFRLMSRPSQEGDVAQYYAARAAFLTAAEEAGIEARTDRSPCYARDRNRGAAGD